MATSTDGLEFVRVSTGSQDEKTQVRDLDRYAGKNGINVVDRVILHGYSASAGEQEPAIHDVIEGIRQRRYSVVLITESSRLDRRENKWAQMRVVIDVMAAGGRVISITEPNFANDVVDTALAQKMNAEKSKTVKDSTWRGVQTIIENRAWYGQLPPMWEAAGERYSKVATCKDPDAVRDVYEAMRNGHSLSSIARKYGTYPQSIRNLVRTEANKTGIFECRYTYGDQTYTWQHNAAGEPPVDSELWHAANRVMGERGAVMNNLGGRPITLAKSWISGLLPCPGCGGNLYVLRGKTLRCGGKGKDRRSCGVSGISLAGVTDQTDQIVSSEYVAVYRYQRVSGNQGELDGLKAELDRVRQTLAATDDDSEFERLAERRKTLRDAIASFELIPEKYEMTPTGETLADLWRTGDKREIMKAIMRHIRFNVNRGGHVRIEGMYPDGTLIPLNDETCIKVSSIGLQRRRLAQYRSTTEAA